MKVVKPLLYSMLMFDAVGIQNQAVRAAKSALLVFRFEHTSEPVDCSKQVNGRRCRSMVFVAAGIEIVNIPYQAPSAVAERWVRTTHEECLARMCGVLQCTALSSGA